MSSRRLAQRSLHLLDSAGRAAESSSEAQRRSGQKKKQAGSSKAQGETAQVARAKQQRKRRGKRTRAERVDHETKTAAQIEEELKMKLGMMIPSSFSFSSLSPASLARRQHVVLC